VCDGYDELPKTWIFENPKPARESSSPSSDDTTEGETFDNPAVKMLAKLPGSEWRCRRCRLASFDCECLEGPLAEATTMHELVRKTTMLGLAPSGKYRTLDEQCAFKYFMEVGAPNLARADISRTFWLSYIPMAAYNQDAIRDGLLSGATIFHTSTNQLLRDEPSKEGKAKALAYENRAIASLVKEPPSVEGMLMASCVFWFTAVSQGSWAKSMQHMYHALKIINDVQDRSRHDQLVLRYTEVIATSSLAYYRQTRGPCRNHLGGKLIDCAAECFIPPPMSKELRVADAYFHLEEALMRLEDIVAMLEQRQPSHMQHDRIISLIRKQERELRYLVKKWSDPVHLDIDPKRLALASMKVPLTFSPFKPVHDALEDFVLHEGNSQTNFGDLELRMRIIMPTFMAATNQGDTILLIDTYKVLYATTWIEGRKKLESDPGRELGEKILHEFELESTSPP
jgi:hypothetical protein